MEIDTAKSPRIQKIVYGLYGTSELNPTGNVGGGGVTGKRGFTANSIPKKLITGPNLFKIAPL